MGMVVLVPVFAPGGQLQRTQPPDVLTGVSFFRVIEVRQAVDKTLHMQRIDQTNRTDPEEALPSENQAAAEREQEHRGLGIGPKFVKSTAQLGAPLLLIGPSGLIQPPQVGPPEPSLLRAGDVFRRVGVGVMMAMIGDPTRWTAAAAEDGPEDQEVFDEPVELESAV